MITDIVFDSDKEILFGRPPQDNPQLDAATIDAPQRLNTSSQIHTLIHMEIHDSPRPTVVGDGGVSNR